MEIKVFNQKIKLDSAQNSVFKHLSHLAKQITKISKKNPTRLAIKNLFFNQEPIKNLYIYGKVGRGKSMLMRHFFENLPTTNKIYFHFNSFMQEVHKNLHKLRVFSRKSGDELMFLATKQVIGNAKVICFDEMQVEDVADAMILQGVFNYFIVNKIVVVTTSNCHPLELYENGLQRELFLKFVNEVLLNNFLVLNLDGKIDYRSQFIDSKQHYFYPNNSENKKTILNLLLQVTENKPPQTKEIEVLGRRLLIKNTYKNIAFFDFKELCEADLGVADYQAIVKEFSLIFLLNVPILKPEDRNEAKRLIWFIDEVYEAKTKLLVLAQSKPEEIYVKGIGEKAFKRTASRLNELGYIPN
jgi:cell division protein ZapE